MPHDIGKLHKDCKALAGEAKKIGEDLQKVRKGPPNDIGKPLEGISSRIVELAKKILELATNLEDTGKALLKNGEALRDEGKLTPEINNRLKVQGKKLQDCGSKLVNIGKKIDPSISERISNIAGRLEKDQPDIGKALKNIANELKPLGAQIGEKGQACDKIGEALQKLEPSIKDPGINKDLEDIETALGEIGNDLEAIKKVCAF